ncbi:MAG TPA: hypothetical protein VFH54_04885 [Mycobacteriales bacterium]|nr:hypothetical protein [Mycobacteriales bacterium]
MRWEALFADLEGQLASADSAELAAEVSDRSRRELARLALADRAAANIGAVVTVSAVGAGIVHATLARVGPDWWLLAEGTVSEVLVPLGAVEWVSGLSVAAREPETGSIVESRLGLGYVLRAAARNRAVVSVMLRGGDSVTGTIDGVGADFVELAAHSTDEPRRPGNVHTTRTVPLAALSLLRLRG